jgi:hypothetical protein
MTIDTHARPLACILPLTILCLALAGCASSAAAGPDAAPDRLAAARSICRDTMGLDPANAPHGQCVDSLLQNSSDDRIANPVGPGVLPAGGPQAACAQFGLRPDSDAFASCAANLDATIFEAAHPISG